MGSFNTTCFASGQTIADDDPCFIIPIKQSIGYNKIDASHGDIEYDLVSPIESTCYANAFWEPIGDPISCKYYDYGQVIIDGDERNLTKLSGFFSRIKPRLLKVEAGENSYHDLAFDPTTLDPSNPIKSLESFWEISVQEHRAFALNYKNLPCAVDFAIISKAARDELIELASKTNNIDTKYQELLDLFNQVDSSIELIEIIRLSEKINTYIRTNIKIIYEDVFTLCDNIVKNGLTEEYKSILRELLETSYMYTGLESLSIKIQPIIYNDQDYSNDIGKSYSKFVSATSKKITELRKEYFE